MRISTFIFLFLISFIYYKGHVTHSTCTIISWHQQSAVGDEPQITTIKRKPLELTLLGRDVTMNVLEGQDVSPRGLINDLVSHLRRGH